MEKQIFDEKTMDKLTKCNDFQLGLYFLLYNKGDLNRNQICSELGFKILPSNRYEMRTTVYDNLLKLKNKRLITKFEKSNGKRGRPIVFWRVKLAHDFVKF